MIENELTNRNNKGVFIEEHDYSLFNITPYYNQINLVIGCSKSGVINTPVIVTSPENFEQIYGKRDYNLERKGSYFHRTVMNMLEVGPVMCLNIRNTDRELDNFNFINISTASDILNSQVRTAPIEDFYNLVDGFWRRSIEDILKVSSNTFPDAKKRPITVVNQNSNPVSLLFYKSETRGFEVTLEEWFRGNVPSYLHPKDLVSDYIINVIAIEGKWNNYDVLSSHPTWSKYFTKSGIRGNQVENFIREHDVQLLKKWTGSTIPYFKDNRGKDMYIQSVVNDDVNETGILLAYDTDVETEFRNGILDITGDNITGSPIPLLDFLSYKRNLTDFYLVEEKGLDQPNNAFGNPKIELGSRTQRFSEGVVSGMKMKPLYINDTQASIHVMPFDFDIDDDAYIVLNGRRIDVKEDLLFTIDLDLYLNPGNKFALVFYVDTEGVKYKVSNQVRQSLNIVLPSIVPETEMVLGYYVIRQSSKTLMYKTEVYGVSIDEKGFINPFNNKDIYHVPTTSEDKKNQHNLIFNIVERNYTTLRNYHMWYWLSNNIKEKESLVCDDLGQKQLVDRVSTGYSNGIYYINITALNKTCNISDVVTTSIYMTDLEFLPQKEKIWREKIQLFVEGEDGIIGEDSMLYDSFVRGDINSGDPFFRSVAVEENVQFVFRNGENFIILNDVQVDYEKDLNKILVYGTQHNDGLYHILGIDFIDGNYALKVNERVSNEAVETIQLFNAEIAKVVNLFFKDGIMMAKVELYEGDLDNLYRKIFTRDNDTQWNKTLEIEEVLAPNKILVSSKYSKLVEVGLYLLGNEKTKEGHRKRNWTRIVDAVRWAKDETLLLIETDAPIVIKNFDDDLQTNLLIPIPKWVETLDFKVLEGHVVRKESLPNGTEERQSELLDLLNNTKMAKALCTDRLSWRYLIDSFGLGLIPNSKFQLAQLCENKKLAMGFLNVPSIKSFRMNKSTRFTTNGTFDTRKLLNGGERSNSDAIRFSISETGKSHIMFITPYVLISELGKMLEVPPASFVAQQYMKKHNTDKYKVWEIIAGTRHRLTNIAGLEHIFDTDQLEDLNIMRLCALTTYQNYVFYLHDENTAYEANSLLGYAHNRETLIELEITLKSLLEQFHWSLYTDLNTNRIIESADEICELYKNNDAIADYLNEIVIDSELIDSQIAVLNTYIELVAGMGKIVLRINVLKTNTIEKGGY